MTHKSDLARLNSLKRIIAQGYNNAEEFDEYTALGNKLFKSKLESKKFRNKFYAGEF